MDWQQETCDGPMLRWLMEAATDWLRYNAEDINRMNVFPVPDGDTGTNMLMTMDKVVQHLAQMNDARLDVVADAIAQAARIGSGGNSGTILSFLLRGFADAVQGEAQMDGLRFAHACQAGVRYAYETISTVTKPVEGTILTVARKGAAALSELAKHETKLLVLLEGFVEAMRRALAETPDELPKLREAGVVDSGGMGLLILFEGMLRLAQGLPVKLAPREASASPHTADLASALAPESEEGYGYDVQFLMLGSGFDVARIRQDLAPLGWSLLVDGDAELVKVHIHVVNPAEPLGYAIAQGAQLDRVIVENMQLQYQDYVRRRSGQNSESAPRVIAGTAVIAVSNGAGLAQVMHDYGVASIVTGGQSMNPTTEHFLQAIHRIQADAIILLPNNKNILLAAQQAAQLSDGATVRVVPSRSIPQGIAALLAYADQREAPLEVLVQAMEAAMRGIRTLEITRAVRASTLNELHIAAGDWIGLLDGDLVASAADVESLLQALLTQALTENQSLLTCYYGADLRLEDAQAQLAPLQAQYPHLEFELVAGGQTLYPYLISLE